MNDGSLSAQLRHLSSDYYHNRIDFEQYRAQRKIILDKVDEEFNGQHLTETQADAGTTSIFMRTIEYFKKTDS